MPKNPATWRAATCWRVALETKGWTLVCSGLVHVWVPFLWRFTEVYWCLGMGNDENQESPRQDMTWHGPKLKICTNTLQTLQEQQKRIEAEGQKLSSELVYLKQCPISGLSRSSSRVVHLHELIIMNQIPYSRRHPQVITCKNQFLDTPILSHTILPHILRSCSCWGTLGMPVVPSPAFIALATTPRPLHLVQKNQHQVLIPMDLTCFQRPFSNSFWRSDFHGFNMLKHENFNLFKRRLVKSCAILIFVAWSRLWSSCQVMGISEESPIGKFLTTIKSKTPQELFGETTEQVP